MQVLKAYFDETGSSGSRNGYFAVCGYLAPKDEWCKFEGKWRGLLTHPCHYPIETANTASVCRPLDYLHATDMEGLGKKRFRRLGQQNRDWLIRSSVTAIIKSGLIGIGAVVVLDAYNALDHDAKEILGDPYFLCFQHVIVETSIQAKMFLGEDHSEDIAFVFEQNPKWEVRLHEMYNLMKAAHPTRYRMGTIAFAEKSKFMPLQAADRLCYETYKHFVEEEERPQMRRFLDWPQHHGRQYNREGLQHLVQEFKRNGLL